MQVKKLQLELDMEKKKKKELDMEQWTGSKLGKECVKAVCYYPAYLTSMQSTSCKMLDEAQAGIQIPRKNINSLRYADNTTLMAESEEEIKSLLMKVKKESGKSWLKTQHSKNEDHGIPSLHGK